MKTSIFTEQLDLSEAIPDTEARVLRNVVLIRAGMSKNRRHYPETVLQASASLFENVASYDGHSGRARSVAETTGFYKNVRYDNGALRADRFFSGTQAGKDVWSVAEDIVSGRAPNTLAGLSINAVGTAKQKKFDDGDGMIIESITSVHSVDDVSTPAAGGAYTESLNGDALAQSFIEALTFEEFFESRPDYIQRIQKEMKTVRQDDAVTAAKAEADHNLNALKEAQSTIERLTQEREAAVLNEQTARREVLVLRALEKITLPASWRKGLEEALIAESDPSKWVAIIEREKAKAQAAGYKPKVQVTGAGQQISPEPEPIREAFTPLPKPEEDLSDWLTRLAAGTITR